MFVSYWHKMGFDIFSIKDHDIKKIASGDISSIGSIKVFGKKVMIVAREFLVHARKRYPPTTMENIKKSINIDVKDMFPLQKPDFFFRIFEKTSTYSLVDIWAWESDHYEKIRKVFPFTHVLPEDMAFISEESEVSLFEQNGLLNLVAHNKNGFIGGLSTRTLTDMTLEMFLHSLGRSASGIRRIRVYNTNRISDKNSLGNIPLVYEQGKDYPVCLRDIIRSDLREFKVKGQMPFSIDIQFVLRVAIYLLAVYSVSLYINKRNYELAIDEVSKKLNAIKAEQSSIEKGRERDEYSEVINEFNEKRKSRLDPLLIMDSLAQSIPDGSYLTRVLLNEGNLELSFASNDPLDVIKSLSTAKCIKSVKLKGAPMKSRDGTFNFLLSLEPMPCQ